MAYENVWEVGSAMHPLYVACTYRVLVRTEKLTEAVHMQCNFESLGNALGTSDHKSARLFAGTSSGLYHTEDDCSEHTVFVAR